MIISNDNNSVYVTIYQNKNMIVVAISYEKDMTIQQAVKTEFSNVHPDVFEFLKDLCYGQLIDNKTTINVCKVMAPGVDNTDYLPQHGRAIFQEEPDKEEIKSDS